MKNAVARKAELEKLLDELKEDFPLFPLTAEEMAGKKMDFAIAEKIEKDSWNEKSAVSKTVVYKKLIEYCYNMETLSGEDYRNLSYFLMYKEMRHKKGGVGEFIEDGARNTFAAGLSYVVFGQFGLVLTLAGFFTIYSSFSFFFKYTKDVLSKITQKHDLTYKEFREDYTRYIQKILKDMAKKS